MGTLYKSLPEFLGEKIRNKLLEYALSNESQFEATKVWEGRISRQDERARVSSYLNDLGDFRAIIENHVLAQVPRLYSELGMTPFEPSGVETEIVAHGDGAFYKRHIDTFTGTGRTPGEQDRLLSLVYYFYREPKSFSGGELRLYPLPGLAGQTNEGGIDITPVQDTAVAFASWVPHEVLKISCPSGEFANSRFAVNCWVLRVGNTSKA